MEVNSIENNIISLTLTQTIKVKDTVMVVIGNEFDKDDWQYGETFKVKKICIEPWGTFVYKNNKQNIDIKKIIKIK